MTQHTPGLDDRTLAVIAHLSAVVALLVSAGWLSWAGPLIVYLVARRRGPLVRTASATSFNFAVTIFVAVVVGWVCIFTIVLLPVGLVLLFVPGVLQIVFSIIGAVRASRGEQYRYPLQIPILH